MNKTQMVAWQKHMGVLEGDEWDKFATVEDPGSLQSFLDQVPFLLTAIAAILTKLFLFLR